MKKLKVRVSNISLDRTGLLTMKFENSIDEPDDVGNKYAMILKMQFKKTIKQSPEVNGITTRTYKFDFDTDQTTIEKA